MDAQPQQVKVVVDGAAAAWANDMIQKAVERNFFRMNNTHSALCHVMSGIVRNQLTHLCPQTNLECMVGA